MARHDGRKRRGFSKSFEEALYQIKRVGGFALRGGAAASVLAAGSLTGTTGCEAESTGPEPAAFSDLKADGWLDSEGQRNTDMVRYGDSSWHEYYDCNFRGGCMGVAIFLKVNVMPVAGADIDRKRVGVEWNGLNGDGGTAVGQYFTTHDDGWEEWHIRVDRRSYDNGIIRFDAWYQDGLGNTYFDDNGGEGHVEAYRGVYSVISSWMDYDNPVTAGEDGVQGRLNLSIADLDYDKEIEMVWTTDGWETANVFSIGEAYLPNNFYWIEDTWWSHERWAIDLDIEGPVERFEYAIVYRHGVVGDAEVYEFWDNNYGYNHAITAQ